jgi:hypothetical protein
MSEIIIITILHSRHYSCIRGNYYLTQGSVSSSKKLAFEVWNIETNFLWNYYGTKVTKKFHYLLLLFITIISSYIIWIILTTFSYDNIIFGVFLLGNFCIVSDHAKKILNFVIFGQWVLAGCQNYRRVS